MDKEHDIKKDLLNQNDYIQDIKLEIETDEFVSKKIISEVINYINDNTKILNYLGEEGLISGVFHRRAILDGKKHLNILSKIYKDLWDEDYNTDYSAEYIDVPIDFLLFKMITTNDVLTRIYQMLCNKKHEKMILEIILDNMRNINLLSITNSIDLKNLV